MLVYGSDDIIMSILGPIRKWDLHVLSSCVIRGLVHTIVYLHFLIGLEHEVLTTANTD